MKWTVLVAAAISGCLNLQAQQQRPLTTDLSNLSKPVSPSMWGVFFEDINLGADGGIYAELIKNRSFEFYKPMMGWKTLGTAKKEGSFTIQNRSFTKAANPRFLRVQFSGTRKGELGLQNEGFRGMGLKQSLPYDFSVNYTLSGAPATLHLELLDDQNRVIGNASVQLSPTEDWKQQTASITSKATTQKGKFQFWIEGQDQGDGTLNMDMISLFPTDTWKGRKGGLRADMVQMLADLQPGFIRFPGGCIVEGHELETRYQWKKTVGPLEDRQLIVNRWNTEFAHRSTPDYFQSFGLGFFEYFQLAEDLNAEPLPILNCGMACQFNTGELVPMEQLDTYIQDALDLIEFANGDVSTKWGALRKSMGHAQPFNLKYLGVGNENWGPQYVERLQAFTNVLKRSHPEISIIASSGTDPEGERFELLDKALRAIPTDIIDEHYYRKPEWFFSNAGRYDSFDRNGPKIFAGEYASHAPDKGNPYTRNNWLAALSEAAFMTGLERNADVVKMASYAPLFAHVDGWQWTPDLIWVNNLQAYGSPSYYVQQLFSTNKGTHMVNAIQENKPLAGKDSLYVSSVYDANTKELIVKMVNACAQPRQLPIALKGKKRNGSSITEWLLRSSQLELANSIENPKQIAPVKTVKAISKAALIADLTPYSLTVWRIPVK